MLKAVAAAALGLAALGMPAAQIAPYATLAAPLSVPGEPKGRIWGALAEILALLVDKSKRTDDEAKIDSQVLLAMRAIIAGNQEGLPVYIADFIREHVDANGMVLVTLDAKVSPELLDALRKLEARVVTVFEAYGSITVQLRIIDLPQSLDSSAPSAFACFERDVANVARYFERAGVPIDVARIVIDMWQRQWRG